MTDTTKKPARPGVPKPGRRADALAAFTPPVAPGPVAQPAPDPQPAAPPAMPPAADLATPPSPTTTPPAAPPAVTEPVSKLANLLTGEHRSDPAGEPPPPPAGETGSGIMHALLGGAAPVDPMKDLVGLGTRVPRHFKEALRLYAFAQRRTEQELVQQALENLLGADLLADALTASRSRPR